MSYILIVKVYSQKLSICLSSNSRRQLGVTLEDASSAVKVLVGEGRATHRAVAYKRTLQPRYTNHREPTWWASVSRAPAKRAKTSDGGEAIDKSSRHEHRGTDDGTMRKIDEVNWGSSLNQLSHDCEAKTGRTNQISRPEKQRDSDEAIVSDEPLGQQNPKGSQEPLGKNVVDKNLSSIAEKATWGDIPTITKYKSNWPKSLWVMHKSLRLDRRRVWLNSCLKPYWGKPDVRNFRGDAGNVEHELMTICHEIGNDRYLRKSLFYTCARLRSTRR